MNRIFAYILIKIFINPFIHIKAAVKKYILTKEFIKLFVSISLAIKLYVICDFLNLGIIVYKIILTFLIFTIFHAITFLVIRFFYSGIYDYINKQFHIDNFKTPLNLFSIAGRSAVIIGIIAIYLFSLILIFAIL